MDAPDLSDVTDKEAAAAAKARGTKHFQAGENEQAVLAYEQAAKHDPTDHVFHSNICACHLELCKKTFEPELKLDHAALALKAACTCTTLNSTWVKGFVRKANAEAELLSASAHLEERKKSREPMNYDGKPWPEPDPALKSIVESASFASCEATCRAGLALEHGNAALRLRLQSLRDDGHVSKENEDLDRVLVDLEAAAPLKAEGNSAFSAKKFEDAAAKYTAALSFNPFDHIFYSNRSACYAGLDGEHDSRDKALRDADTCLALQPSFVKGYSRRSAALYGLGRYVEAEAAAAKGLELEPTNAALQALLDTARLETKETPAVQAEMHRMRVDRAKNEKMKKMLSGLNLGGNVQMFGPGGGMGGLGGGGGMGGLEALLGGGGGGNLQAPAQTDDQLRMMARAVAGATAHGPSETSQMSARERWKAQQQQDECCTKAG